MKARDLQLGTIKLLIKVIIFLWNIENETLIKTNSEKIENK